MNRYIDGWKCEEAIIFALNIFSTSIQKYEDTLEELSIREHDDNGNQIVNPQQDIEFDRVLHKSAQAKELLEALQHEVQIAIEHHAHLKQCQLVQMGKILPEDVIWEQPDESTVIELYKYIENQKPEEIKIKKKSFAIWLHQIGEKNLGIRVEPNLQVNNVKTERNMDLISNFRTELEKASQEHNIQKPCSLKNLIEAEETPDYLYLAYDVFLAAWKDLPVNMKRPTKSQLTDYLMAKGIKEQTTIDAIIKVSTPDEITLGGKQKPDLVEWLIKSKRK
ncbi:hypothetical protein [Aliiglaciecola sp. NS0011-25]|uniref:hypothetical protein n=1 Tax=Aliiglaciecola sp. NS0011-25 TaxID=3127654 RepID=UPI0031058B93